MTKQTPRDWAKQNARTPQMNIKFKNPEQIEKVLTAASKAGMTPPAFIRKTLEEKLGD